MRGGFKRRPRFLLGAERYPDLQVEEDGLGTKSCSGGGQYPHSGAPPPTAPPFLPQLGQSCAPAQQPDRARARELLPSES